MARYNDGRTDDITVALCDEGCQAIAIGSIWALSCAYRNDSEDHSENQNQTSDCDKTFHDDLLYIDSKFWASYRHTEPTSPYVLKYVFSSSFPSRVNEVLRPQFRRV